MKSKRYTTEQKIRILRDAERADISIVDVCRKKGISEQTFHRWKRWKKVVSPGHKRQIAGIFVNRGLCSERAACRHFGLHRSTFQYEAKQPNAWLARLKIALKRMSRLHPELGYSKITRLLKDEGWQVGNRMVQRLRPAVTMRWFPIPIRPEEIPLLFLSAGTVWSTPVCITWWVDGTSIIRT